MSGYDSFFSRRVYRRIRDCWNRPTTGVAGEYIHVKMRRSQDYNATFQWTGEVRRCYNLSSYNYLGFSSESAAHLTAEAKAAALTYGLSAGGSSLEMGRHVHPHAFILCATSLCRPCTKKSSAW
jgi:7-keto-8-aminopelargonate synthetase-like enzyme